MAVPKGFRTNIDINPSKIGVERRIEILDGIKNKGTYLPKSIFEEDLDAGFISFVKNNLNVVIEGAKVPVVFLTIQRWYEFTKTWEFTEGEYKDIKLPFITIVRKPEIQVGQNQAGLYNIPGNRTYTYMKVPTFDGSRNGVDVYKVPQPTSIDLDYEVRLFTTRMKDLNILNSKVHTTFQSRQAYINVNGHPIPIHLEGVGDESNTSELESRKFYVQLFNMKMLGYILDEKEFKIIPTINRIYQVNELDLSSKKNVQSSVINSFLIRIVNTYADMISQSYGNKPIIFLVINDEDKGLTFQRYEYYPNESVLWIASADNENLITSVNSSSFRNELNSPFTFVIKIVNSYTEMSLQCNGDQPISFLVLNDEDKGLTFQKYEYYPNERVLWVASVENETNIISNNNMVLDNGNKPTIYNTFLIKIVSSYSEMISQAKGNQYIIFLVLNDEDKGLTFQKYEYYQNGIILWIASTINQ